MKMKTLVTAVLAITIAGAASSASANEAETKACAFAASLGGGLEPALENIISMADWWSDADRAKLDPNFRPQMDGFNYEAGLTYIVTDFAPFMQEYLVVTGDLRRGVPLYFRLRFSGTDSGLLFSNIDFNSNLDRIFTTGLIMEPKPVVCR